MFGAAALNETLLIPPSSAPSASSHDPAAAGTPPSPRKRFFKTRRTVPGDADSSTRYADEGAFVLHERRPAGAVASMATARRAKRARRTAGVDPIDDSITHTHFLNPMASIDTSPPVAERASRDGVAECDAATAAGPTLAQQRQQRRDQDAFEGDMEATLLAARKLNFDGVVADPESGSATTSPRAGTNRGGRRPSPLAQTADAAAGLRRAGSSDSSIPSLPDDLAQKNNVELSLFDLGAAMAFGPGAALPSPTRPRGSPYRRHRRKVRRQDPDDLWAADNADDDDGDSSSGDSTGGGGRAGAGAMQSPSNTHLAPIINADSEAMVNHGPSKHFSMLQRSATKSGAARPVWEGWLTKQGAVRRNWKRRWCILDEAGVLRYYKPSEYIPRGVVIPRAAPGTFGTGVVGAGTRLPAIPTPVLSGEAVEEMTVWPADSGAAGTKFAVQTGLRTFFFFADTVADAGKWTGLIQTIGNHKSK